MVEEGRVFLLVCILVCLMGRSSGSYSETGDRSTRFQFVVLSAITILWRKEKGGGRLSIVSCGEAGVPKSLLSAL